MKMKEGKIKAVAKKPMLNREAAKDYEFAEAVWRLNDFHTQHGGSPTIIGIVTIMDASIRARTVPRYKLEFPDGFIDYARVDNFDEFYDMGFEPKPEDRVREYYNLQSNEGRLIDSPEYVIKHVLDLLEIKIKGVNA